jgi:aldehyde:ferredoxin oxidoreductase
VLPEPGIDFGDRHEGSSAKAEAVARLMDWRALTNSLILCHFEDPPGPEIPGLIRSVTGWDQSWADMARTGERIFSLRRLLNLRWGLTPADDALPALLTRPLPEGGTGGYAPDADRIGSPRYAARGYSPTTEAPSAVTLVELGLEWLTPPLPSTGD